MRKARVDPVQRVTQTWVTRAQILAKQNGVTPQQFNQKLAPIVKQDIKKVREGGNAMSNTDALNASMYNLYGQAAVKEPKRDAGLNPLTVLENAVTDIKDITMNAVPGVVDFVGDTVIPKNLMGGPSEWEKPPVIEASTRFLGHGNDPKWLKEHGYDPKAGEGFTPESIAAALRLVFTPESQPGGKGQKAKAKGQTIWQLAPGGTTLARATTEKGRAEITGHPVMTALDLLPVAAAGTKILGAGLKAAEAGGALGKLAEAGETGTKLGSVVEAARQGKPLKTAYRATVPEATRGLIAEKVVDFTEKRFGTSKPLSHITRVFSITDRMNSRKVEAWMKKHPVIDEMMKLDDETQKLIQDEAVNPNKYLDDSGTSTISPEHKAIIDQLDNAATEILNKRAGARNLRIRGHNVWYAGDSMVTKLYDRLNSTQRSRTRAQVSYNDVARRTMDRYMSKWVNNLNDAQRRIDKNRPVVAALDKEIRNLEVERGIRSAQGRPIRALENKIDRLSAQRRKARKPAFKASMDWDKARVMIKTAYREVNVNDKKVAGARVKRDQLFRTQERLTKELDANVDKTPPAEYLPMLQNEANRRIYEQIVAKDPALADDLGEAATALGYTEDAYLKYMSKEEYDAIWQEVAATWTKLADEGHKPIWVHPYDRVEISAALKRTPLPARVNNITRLRHSIEDQAPSMTPIAVALTAAAYENILHDGSRYFIQNAINPHKISHDGVMDWARTRLERERKRGRLVDEDDLVAMQHLIAQHWRSWSPENPFRFNVPKLTPEVRMARDIEYVPKNHADTIDKLSHPYAKSEVGRFGEKAQRIFKASVLTFSLKHLADEFFGGMIYMAARGHVDTWANFPKAFRMVNEGKMPVEIPTQIELTGAVWQNASGNKAGKLYQQAGGKIWQLKEYINNVYRSMDYLGEKSFLQRTEGISPEVAKARALQHTYKAMMDLDSMTPLQRSALRSAFPFYSFIRYSLKYLMTYPTDYPIRAAILSKLAQIEDEDYSSGLPQIFNQMFQLGAPDAAGEALMLDTKVMNPFRDMGNYFTFTGFLGSFTPVLTIPMTMMGLNTQAGAAELYPQITVDPKTGSIMAKRPSGGIGKGIQAFIPETRIFDYVLGLSDETRDLKKRDPEAFDNKLYDILMLPFAPKKYNTAEQRGKLAQNWVTLAQQALTNAQQYPDRAGQYLKPYEGGNVPYQGHVVPTELVKNLIKQSAELAPEGVSPQLLMPGIKSVKGDVQGVGIGGGLTPSSTLESLMRSGLLKPGATSGANQ